jgi:hypothetical protein
MKKILLLTVPFLMHLTSFSQSIGTYQILDFLVEATHPTCSVATNKYIVGQPNDSIWVNSNDSSAIVGFFGSSWVDGNGNDLVIESGYQIDDYEIRLLLSDSSFSNIHDIDTADWVEINNSVNWIYLNDIGNCLIANFSGSRKIIALDFNVNFGLTSIDTVIGIEITFINTINDGDIAGVYITDSAILTSTKNHTSYTEFFIYPNPAKEYVTIKSETNVGEILIYNINGQLILHFEIEGKPDLIRIPTQNLTTGMYLIELKTDSNTSFKKKLILN